MEFIRRAGAGDASRLAEILVFTKRMSYRSIFHNDMVSFGEMQVYPLVCEYIHHPEKLENIWVYGDAFAKGMIHIEEHEIKELYVDVFFQKEGIGRKLIDFAVRKQKAGYLWVLEKNGGAIRFYEANGFVLTGERMPEEGTEEFIVKMAL